MWETWFQSLGWEDSLEEGMETHFSINLQIPWIIEKVSEFQKNMCFWFIDYTKVFDCEDHIKLWKILKEMGIPDHLTCLLRNMYAGQATELDMEQQTGSKSRKEYIKAVYCHPAYLTYMQNTS